MPVSTVSGWSPPLTSPRHLPRLADGTARCRHRSSRTARNRWLRVRPTCADAMALHRSRPTSSWRAPLAVAEHPIRDYVERIEQAGNNRVVVTSAGIIHDMYADGTVGERRQRRGGDPTSRLRISVAATFEDGVLVLRAGRLARRGDPALARRRAAALEVPHAVHRHPRTSSPEASVNLGLTIP